MTQLIGLLKDSIGNPVTTYLTVELAAPLIDITTTPDSVYYGIPKTYKILNGNLTTVQDTNGVSIPAGIVLTPTDEPVYKFTGRYEDTVIELYLDGKLYASIYSDGSKTGGDWHLYNNPSDTPDMGNQYYTGAVHTPESLLLTQYNRVNKLALFEPFYSHIDDVATLEWSTLQHSSINTSNINTSLAYIARLLTTGTYLASLVDGIYNPMGDWSVGTLYSKGDVVYYDSTKGSYWYINDSPSTGNLPTNTTYWQKLLTTIDTGAGNPSDAVDDTPFGIAWQGITNLAPSQNAVYDELIQYAKLADATFTVLKAPTKSVGTNNTEVATTAHVVQALAAFTPPPATTAPTVEHVVRNTNIVNTTMLNNMGKMYARVTEEKPVNNPGGSAAATKIRNLEFIKENSTYNASGSENIISVVAPYVSIKPGRWLLRGKAALSARQTRSRLDVVTDGGLVLINGLPMDTGLSAVPANDYPNFYCEVVGVISIASATFVGLRQSFSAYGSYNTELGRPANLGTNEIYAQLEIQYLGL